jgi:hypothetical protein
VQGRRQLSREQRPVLPSLPHTHTGEGETRWYWTAGVYGGVERLSHGAYSSSLVHGGEGREGSLQRGGSRE